MSPNVEKWFSGGFSKGRYLARFFEIFDLGKNHRGGYVVFGGVGFWTEKPSFLTPKTTETQWFRDVVVLGAASGDCNDVRIPIP